MALVHIEVFQACVGVQLVAFVRCAGEGAGPRCLQGRRLGVFGLSHHVVNVGLEGDVPSGEVHGDIARVKVGGDVAFVGLVGRRELEDDAEGVGCVPVGDGNGHDARGGIVGALIGDVPLPVVEGGVVLVHGERQTLPVGKGVGVVVHLHVQRIASLGEGRVVGGEVDGFVGGVFEVQDHGGKPLVFGGRLGLGGLHGEGQEAEGEQERDDHAHYGAAAGRCGSRGGWTDVIHGNSFLREPGPRGTGGARQMSGRRA